VSAEQLTMDDAFDAATAEGWTSSALAGIEALALTGRIFQAFDLVDQLGVPEPKSPAAWGAVFNRARRLGLIRRVGYAQSKRPTVAGSACAEWVGAA
jgi:hypothetical protein